MEFLNIQETLSHLFLKEDMTAAEFGAGSAIFTLALAKKLPKGKVFALDIQEEKLSALKGRLSVEKISNVSVINCDLEEPRGSKIDSRSLDVVLIPNTLFQTENKYAIMEEARRILKNGGQLLVLDWLKQTAFSPKKENMVSPEKVKEIADSLGLSLKKEFMAGDYHYALLFIK